jgi:hypothetical protein
LLLFPRLHFSAVFRGKNLRALQIFFGVNVLGLFLLAFLASLFLASRISNILSVGLRVAKKSAGDDENTGAGQPDKSRRGPRNYRDASQWGGIEISSQHIKPTTGGHRLMKSIPKTGDFGNAYF